MQQGTKSTCGVFSTNEGRLCTWGAVLHIKTALLINSCGGFEFGCWVHTGGNLAGAGELQHTVEWQFFIFVSACKLGSDDSVSDLELTEIKKIE